MTNLSFQYPAWFLIFCLLLGLGYAMLLYYRDTTFKESAPGLHRWLGLLRMLSIALLSMLLLSPLLRSILTDTKKPVIVLAQDQSESIGLELSGEKLELYKKEWQALKDALANQYEVHEMAIGDAAREGVDFKFEDKISNLSEAVQAIYDAYGTQNLGAVVLASDGIYNEGSNPAYTSTPISAPIYTIALGDTVPKKDLLIKRVFHNKIAYLGDKFTMQIDLGATNCAGTQSVITVSKVNGDQVKLLQSIPVSVDKNDFFVTKEVVLEADQAGVAQYLIRVAGVPGEASEINNKKEVYMDVLDARQKILMLANSPNPDLSALRQTLEANKNHQVFLNYITDSGIDVSKYDFVILHNLPSQSNDIAGIMRVLNEKRIPRLFVAGLQTGFSNLAKEQGLVHIQNVTNQTDDVQGKVSAQFSAFIMDPKVVEELPRFNPVTCSFGSYNATAQAQVILWKRIGQIDTDQPLLVVGETNGVKTGVFLGEGLWKWRLFDYMQHNNHDIFDELLGKTVQYLSLKEDKRKFRVNLDKSIFNENEAVGLGAELYNDNYELTNEPDVSIVIRDSKGKDYNFTFNKLGKAYNLNAGILPTGNYTFSAITTFNGQKQEVEGRFSVRPIELERFETIANHGVLRQLSVQNGGELIFGNQLSTLAEKIKSNQTVKPVIYQTTKTNPLINLKWIFAILLALLSMEWFLRRYYGSY